MKYAVPIVGVAAITAVARALDAEPAAAGLLLLLAVAASALVGRFAGLLAAALAAVAYNFAFLPPTGTFRLDKVSDLVAFGVFVIVALLIGSLISRESELRSEVDLTSTKAAFFAATGHNLRTPLTTVTMAVDTLLDPEATLDDTQRRELLESIRDETQRLSLLVSRSLELSRVREGGLAPEPVDADVLGLVQAAVRRLGPTVAARCRYDADEDVPVVHADLAMTEEILAVLVENASRYAPEDDPIEIRVTGDDAWTDVAVVDHGTGVPDDQRERIFEEYVRGPQVEVSGTGLGLAVARALAEAQGGRVTLETTPGGGATVVLRLPSRPRS